jgi:SOS regulatory protein LexA
MSRKTLDLPKAAQAVKGFFLQHQRPPSYEELRKLFGYRSKNAAFWLVRKLREKGILKRDAQGKLIMDASGIRLLGVIQAGFPSPAEEELADTLSLDQYLVKHPEQSYLIRVTGDSMVGAGILEGDLVIVERGRQPKNGEIVVAQIDGEWTMKYYEKNGKKIKLVAANQKYPSIQPRSELIIGGVVTAVIRKYK